METIYYILGTSCSGKTTISKILCEKYGFESYSGDEHRFDYYKNTNNETHIWMTKDTKDFFNWTLDEMIAWERGVIAEQTPMIMDTLKCLASSGKKILFEGMLDLSILSKTVQTNRICYLTVDQEIAENDFYKRDSHRELQDRIMKDQELTLEERKRRLLMRKKAAIQAFHIDAKKYSVKQYTRKGKSIKEMLEIVENHFELV